MSDHTYAQLTTVWSRDHAPRTEDLGRVDISTLMAVQGDVTVFFFKELMSLFFEFVRDNQCCLHVTDLGWV